MVRYVYEVFNFDLEQIYESGQVFRWHIDDSGYYYITAGDKDCVVNQKGQLLKIQCPNQDIQFWEHYFALDTDYDEYWRALDLWAERDGPDAYLSKAVKATHGMRILNQPIWETAISFIISQNNNIPKIKKTIEDMCYEFYGEFPGPEALCDLDGLDFGLGYRDRYIMDFSQRVLDGRIDLEKLQTMDYNEAKAILKSCFGIGDKVANCILLYSCGHLEAFPIDTWMKKILDREFPDGFPYERYSGFQGLVQQIMFYYERIKGKQPTVDIHNSNGCDFCNIKHCITCVHSMTCESYYPCCECSNTERKYEPHNYCPHCGKRLRKID